ncbi:putative single-strand selective monofunctional uracil DNA glycosylase [Apostichopus japonicus]|uniref:Putative single-strand selective monofunctional uracil DNA glycosylase n=1 Tax=Stichopus japonicus TaxID=307972 RepID=A0A2G8JUQ9_STIJA|nr:putative single-strand selective monofunctional uracil DNA glycosylase [Apostichopus japonicus]
MDDFSEELGNLSFGERVCYIYNPLQYAKETHEDFIRKYCQSTKKVLFLGMNPGPFGMAQNGVPFGERDHVVDWLKIEGDVGKPEREHPKRQIQGLECPRKEVSGRRFWDLWKQLCKTPRGSLRMASSTIIARWSLCLIRGRTSHHRLYPSKKGNR